MVRLELATPWLLTDAQAIELSSSKDIAVRHQLDKRNSFPAIAQCLALWLEHLVYNRGVANSGPIIGNLVVFTIFGSAKCKIFGDSGASPLYPNQIPTLDPVGAPDHIWIRQ